MLLRHGLFYTDGESREKTRFEEDVSVAFLSDVHCGSDRHLGVGFGKFLDWLESEDEDAKKVKYVFFSGDNVDGVGVFPGQENFLALKTMEEQYEQLAGYLRRIPKRITMFMCPGQHDACRVAEPQPIISKKCAAALYESETLILGTIPTLVECYDG